MKKGRLYLIIGLLSIICLLSILVIVFAQTNNQQSIIIVVGQNAAQNDYDTANLISNNLTGNYTVVIVKDSDFIDDNISTIISIGGSCINSLSAQLLDVYYPTCTSDFTLATKVGQTHYLFKTFPLSNNRVEILIAGYEAEDTSSAGKYLISKSMNNIQPRQYYVGSTIKPNP